MKIKGRVNFILVLVAMIIAMTLIGCGGGDGALTDANDKGVGNSKSKESSNDDYNDYLSDALAQVGKDAPQKTSNKTEETDGSEGSPTGNEGGAGTADANSNEKKPDEAEALESPLDPNTDPDSGKVIYVQKKDSPNKDSDDLSDNESVRVSSSESVPTVSPVETPENESLDAKTVDNTEEKSQDKKDTTDGEGAAPTPTPEPTGTPDEFPVDVCQVYIKGKDDSGFGSGIITRINEIRAEMNYPEMKENESLTKCAQLRSREIAVIMSHMRPDGSPFSSLAPDYYKAELFAIDKTDEEETVDAWILYPDSRSLIFTTQYTSIGAACFECNGYKCVIVAYGD